jgi:protein sidekick
VYLTDSLVYSIDNYLVYLIALYLTGPNSAPKAYMRPSRVTVDQGETAVLRCEISGEEPMQIKWLKHGGILPRTAVVKRNYLEIKKTTIRERGRYICTATNKYGQASAIGSLFVNKGREVELC